MKKMVKNALLRLFFYLKEGRILRKYRTSLQHYNYFKIKILCYIMLSTRTRFTPRDDPTDGQVMSQESAHEVESNSSSPNIKFHFTHTDVAAYQPIVGSTIMIYVDICVNSDTHSHGCFDGNCSVAYPLELTTNNLKKRDSNNSKFTLQFNQNLFRYHVEKYHTAFYNTYLSDPSSNPKVGFIKRVTFKCLDALKTKYLAQHTLLTFGPCCSTFKVHPMI